ncbi:aminotransferase class I/II-fold pyridoxal phosphate-dependent enzyme [Proteiniborus sp. MB09-C3]|uniref:aminotransferase class I/II-fold pyridoxal phosphate-dependent enzyme n=1 Tax=Proteiniborus sp. MB09-C3 TaxID=3050072 RepID=UPI0025521F6B|nr:aminotransferase class I/II-fold pyridoxal phosphate-dependent enzyme [Proteiniborus sp. MB09-C3]WIV11431.1 aminotransferase class I/II-fold pyridoxal phosphate-dependent enzyme [Proteiniborus sp. MB09-C3]
MILENMILDNIKNMPPSGIRKYFDMINEMKDVISLGVGEPDFVTPWNIREAGVYSLEEGHTHYSSNAGFIELRVEISKYLNRRFNLLYNPDNEIIVTVGGSEGIDIALRALVGPGDEVIIPEPSFVAYKGCTTFTGATPKVLELREENEFKLTPEMLEKAITPKTKVVIIPFPNNPTGAIMTRQELSEIVEVLKDKELIVISDEIYAELSYSGEHASIASFPEMKDKTIVINGFSKAFAMTGWRLGYVCGHHILVEAMKKIHQYAIMCSPTVSQYAAIEALKNGEHGVREMVKEYNRRRRVLVNGFRKMGLDCFEPLGAFYVFPSIKPTGMNSDEFCEKLLMTEKVLTVPGNAFGDCGEGFIRACYASSMDNIVEALKRIERFVDTQKH